MAVPDDGEEQTPFWTLLAIQKAGWSGRLSFSLNRESRRMLITDVAASSCGATHPHNWLALPYWVSQLLDSSSGQCSRPAFW